MIDHLLADGRVVEAPLASLGTLSGPGPAFVLERAELDASEGSGTERGFLLAGRASEPGVWEPGSYVVMVGRVTSAPQGGCELSLRFRLHPLTRAAYLTVIAVAGLLIPLQCWTTGLLLGTVMMFPIVLAAMVIGLDSRRLGEQRANLQRLVETLFAPLALPREHAERGPFRGPLELGLYERGRVVEELD